MPIRRSLTISLLLAAIVPTAGIAQSGQDNSTGAEAGRIAVRPAQDVGWSRPRSRRCSPRRRRIPTP